MFSYYLTNSNAYSGMKKRRISGGRIKFYCQENRFKNGTIRISNWTITKLICWFSFIGCHYNVMSNLLNLSLQSRGFLIFTQSISLHTVQSRYLIPKHCLSPDFSTKPHKLALSPDIRTFAIQILRKQQPHTQIIRIEFNWQFYRRLFTLSLCFFLFFCSEMYFRCAHLQKQKPIQ